MSPVGKRVLPLHSVQAQDSLGGNKAKFDNSAIRSLMEKVLEDHLGQLGRLEELIGTLQQRLAPVSTSVSDEDKNVPKPCRDASCCPAIHGSIVRCTDKIDSLCCELEQIILHIAL